MSNHKKVAVPAGVLRDDRLVEVDVPDQAGAAPCLRKDRVKGLRGSFLNLEAPGGLF